MFRYQLNTNYSVQLLTNANINYFKEGLSISIGTSEVPILDQAYLASYLLAKIQSCKQLTVEPLCMSFPVPCVPPPAPSSLASSGWNMSS